jgi:hypothetical protein
MPIEISVDFVRFEFLTAVTIKNTVFRNKNDTASLSRRRHSSFVYFDGKLSLKELNRNGSVFGSTNSHRRFEVFTAVAMKNGVSWDVTPCVSCKDRRFGGTWLLLHQGDKNR